MNNTYFDSIIFVVTVVVVFLRMITINMMRQQILSSYMKCVQNSLHDLQCFNASPALSLANIFMEQL